MARQEVIFQAMNRGEVSTQLLGRTDVEHLRMAAQTQENWQPRVLGPMSLRPGSEYIETTLNSLPAKMLPFVAQFNDTAVIELTGNAMRVLVDDEIVTRNAVGTVIPGLGSGSWNIVRQTGTSQVTLNNDGLTFYNLNIGASAAVNIEVNVALADVKKEHGVRLVVTTGPIVFKIGSVNGGDDLFLSAILDTGTYSLAYTPLGQTIWFEFDSAIGPETYSTVRTTQTQGYQEVNVAYIVTEPPGPMTIPSPWPLYVLQAPCQIRQAPSGDVLFIAASGIPQQKIVRYSVTSWSIQLYKPVKGPMSAVPGGSSVILSIGDQVGNTTLTSNQPIFTTDDIGTLFRLFYWQQFVDRVISFSGTWSDAIRVTGVSTISVVSGNSIVDESVPDRNFYISISGTWTGTVTLQRSFSSPTTDYNDYLTYTSNQTNVEIDDSLNNEIVYYRMGCHAGALTSGAPTINISTSGGGGEGVVHVTGYVNSTELEIEVLVIPPFYGPAYDWHQSEWSADRGYPTAVAIHEGRLWWAGSDRWWGSTSDDYSNFDFDEIGDSSYIDITVGQGPIANVNWLLSIDSLLAGGDTQIIVARSDAIQDPLTPTNFNLRFSTSQGSAPIQGVKVDNTCIFVNQSTGRIFRAIYDLYTYNYKCVELSNLNPDIGGYPGPGNLPFGFVAMAVQRNPDTIIHLVRADGQMVCLIFDEADDVKAFWRKTTAGKYEDVIVLPGEIEDRVYVVVNRASGRFIERFARLDECYGDSICKLVDSHVVYTGPATTTISAPWLAGQQVAVWANGADVFNVVDNVPGLLTLDANGNGTLPAATTPIVFGLTYKAQYLSSKLAYGAQRGSAVNEVKKIDHIGFVLQNTHYQGLRYGSFPFNPTRNGYVVGDFNTTPSVLWDNNAPIDDMPLVENGVDIPANTIWMLYDKVKMEWSGNADTDARIYLTAASPRPATVVAATIAMESQG